MEDRCISCGNIIPEGRQICPVCEKVSWELLTIDEIIGHCKRQVQRFDDRYGYGYFETASLELTATKEYWEHKQVAQYLEELKKYRAAEAKWEEDFVRCKDCVHWQGMCKGCTEQVKLCTVGSYMVGENGYCTYGERKVD